MVPRVAFRTLVPLVKLIVPWLLLRPWIVPLKVPVVMLMIELLSRVVVVVVRLPVVRVRVEVSFRVIVLASRLLVLAAMVLLLEMLIVFRICPVVPKLPPRVLLSVRLRMVELVVVMSDWMSPVTVPVPRFRVAVSVSLVVPVMVPLVRVRVAPLLMLVVVALMLLVLAVMVLLLEMLISFRACELDPRSPPKVLLLFRLTVPTALVRPWIVPVMVPVPIARVEVLSVRVIVVALIAFLLVAASRVAADEIIMLFRALVAPMLLADSKV